MKQDKAPYVAKAETKKTEYAKTMQKYNKKLVYFTLFFLFSFFVIFFLLLLDYKCNLEMFFFFNFAG